MRSRLKELDSDKSIKIATCRCLSVLLECYAMKNEDLCACLDLLAHKLKIEVEKVYIAVTLAKFREQSLGKEGVQAVEGVARQAA